MSDAGLSEAEKDMIRRLDWIGLVRYGVNFFVLEKFARVVKTPKSSSRRGASPACADPGRATGALRPVRYGRRATCPFGNASLPAVRMRDAAFATTSGSASETSLSLIHI